MFVRFDACSQVRSLRLIALAFAPSLTFALAWLCPLLLAAVENDRVFTQTPEVANSKERGVEAKPADAAKTPSTDTLAQGPTPQWIWGPQDGKSYYARATFTGGGKSAILRASCDNVFTLFVNGQRVASSDNWQSPVTVDIQKHVKPGANELLAEIGNQGGIAGFCLKLALGQADGTTTYLVTDDQWQLSEKREGGEKVKVTVKGKLGVQPWGDAFSAPLLASGPRDVFNVPPGFKVERLFTVPKDKLGSWVNITFDDKGRLLASDQEGKGLCRITLPPIGSDQPTKVEHLDVKVSAAQGMLYAFGSLYLSVNGGPGSGFYRVRDTNGDDQFDQVEKLFAIRGGGEHGPHGLALSPDGKSIYLACGNHTDPPAKIDASRIPTNWGEDHLLPRQWDANGHAVGRLAPGGWIAKTDPDGKSIEIVSVGYRNQFDLAFNADGELFSYDSDMEWDMGMPWYRPTRATHAVSGSEFGWRSGTGKWPAHYIDSLPQLVDIGPGSPVGVTFGYGAKFPAKYQKALYLCDWTFGTMYALILEPAGSTYKAVKEEFVSRTPLPLTDARIGPDGAMYFTIGGRGVPSELFRVTYVGSESTAPAELKDREGAELRQLRRQLESFHRRAEDQAKAIELAWANLSHSDRFIRYAARVALEHQELKGWRDRVLAEKNPDALIAGAVALARQGDKSDQGSLLAALERISWEQLTETQKLDLLRAWSLVFIRLGEPTKETAAALVKKLDPSFPAASDTLNRELCNMLVYLQSPTIATKTLALIQAPAKEPTAAEMAELLARNPGYGGSIAKMLANQADPQKLHYLFTLRNSKVGWKPEQRAAYFASLQEMTGKSGGSSFQGFLRNMGNDAYENASDSERLAVEAAGLRKPYVIPELPKPIGPGHDWTLDELLQLGDKLKGRNFEAGKRAFAATRCVVCHRFGGEGGATGPDLTQAAGRFSYKEIAEAIIDPSKVVSDQYRGAIITTDSGKVYNGRILSETDDSLTILTDPEDSTKIVKVAKSEIEERKASATSLMPKDLLKTLNRDEVLDLLAYLLSRGNPRDPLFAK
jgi:putative heme-binding domain-containing protein